MGLEALLTVDFSGAEDSRRKIFNDVLVNEWEFKDIDGVSGAWKAAFQADVTKEEAIEAVVFAVMKAAKKSGISEHKAAVQIGDSEPKVFP